ncbi:GGDEF domain-containing protein [Wenzhouxiangella sp. XN79A]|uniref:diguanylate cyclase n=1 Tax=Wenzhouxiangella sp. XN79A TaxID=2724193 RepID=UPI00144A56B0|nr:GGDEF domain-containing protein [Wenzhouxiangella sp. XN79A]
MPSIRSGIDWSRVRQQFREDYQFSMIVLFGLLAASVVTGFVIYRYAFDYYFGGTVNLMIVVSMLLVLVYALRSGETRRAGIFFCVVTVVACIASTAMFGRTGILWGYVVLWVNFLLTSRRFALAANLILMTILIIETSLFESVLEGVTYIVTALLVTTFAWIFAHRLASYQDQLMTLALQDPLTFAGNRRQMRQDLNAALEIHRRTGQAFALALIDLDHFKRINDGQGHDVGDEALKSFADAVRAAIRSVDGFYRFGGEEFVVLLRGDVPGDAEHVVRRLHQRVSGRLAFGGEVLQFSAGVAVLNSGEDWPTWLSRADRALYRAKQGGRNRIELAASPDAGGPAAASPKTGRLGADPTGAD